MVLLWDKWQLHNGNKATFFPSRLPRGSRSPSSRSLGAAGRCSQRASFHRARSRVHRRLGRARNACASRPQRVKKSKSPPTSHRLTFDGEGGSLTHAELLKHADMTDKARRTLCCLTRAPARLRRKTGLIGGSFPTHKTVMTAVPTPVPSRTVRTS